MCNIRLNSSDTRSISIGFRHRIVFRWWERLHRSITKLLVVIFLPLRGKPSKVVIKDQVECLLLLLPALDSLKIQKIWSTQNGFMHCATFNDDKREFCCIVFFHFTENHLPNQRFYHRWRWKILDRNIWICYSVVTFNLHFWNILTLS